MLSTFKYKILYNKTKIRYSIYIVLFLSIIPVFFTLYSYFESKPKKINLAYIFILLYLLVFLLVENIIHWAKKNTIFSGSQNRLFSIISPLTKFMEDADEIDLLGGTFKTFTDNESNLKVLSKKNSDAKIRILMLHPEKIGVESLSRARIARNRNYPSDTIPNEILLSLSRFIDKGNLSLDDLCKIVRLYPFGPTCSIYRFDRIYILTSYTFARGASSPAFFTEKCDENELYCKSLDRGFNELWDSNSTLRLTKTKLKKMGISL